MTLDMLEPHAQVRPLSADEYEVLGASGAYGEQRVELLDGHLVVAAEEPDPQLAAIERRLNRLLIDAIPASEGDVGVKGPLRVSELSVPLPDFIVIEPSTEYRAKNPATASLVIEVAKTSRGLDRGFKAIAYAAAGIPEYWVVDVVRAEVIVHREPAGTSFKTVTRHREGQVRALHHRNVVVDVEALFR